MRKVLPIILIALAVACGAYYGYRKGTKRPVPHGPVLTMHFLNAELGGGIVVKPPHGRLVVIDPGPAETADALADYLREAGAESLVVLVTNPDPDRSGAVASLLETFPIKRFMHGELASRSRTWARTVEAIEGRSVPELVLSAGDIVHLAPSVTLQVLSPPRGLYPTIEHSSDNNSLVTRIAFGRTKLLLASQARIQAEGRMIQAGVDLRSSVLAVARSGRSDSTSLELVSQVRPECFVVQAGEGSNRPRATVLDRISTENTGAEVFRTDKDGVVDVVTDGRRIEVAGGGAEQ